MPFISITRLRVRSVRFLPAFALYTYRSLRQVQASAGFQNGSLLADRSWTFWTMTAWDSQESMRGYMTAGAHRIAMPRLMDWCDEASVVHWDQPQTDLPSWTEADERMRKDPAGGTKLSRAQALRKSGWVGWVCGAGGQVAVDAVGVCAAQRGSERGWAEWLPDGDGAGPEGAGILRARAG